MTLPYEEKRSLHAAKEFLSDLLDPQKTPKVPRIVRQQAGRVLHHYPYNCNIDQMYDIIERVERKKLKDKKYIDIRYGR